MFNGLTITRGYANGGNIDNEGGGVHARGGGVTLANVTRADNFATTGGGVNEDHWDDEMIDLDLDMNWRRENILHVPDTGIPDSEGFTVDMGAYEAWDPTLVFWDDFESGDTWNWDQVVGEP